MRAGVLLAKGGLEHLAVAEVASAPEPGPGEVRVALHAAALNHLDLHVVAGLPGIPYPPRKVLGADGAGVIEDVGPGVTHVRPGDRVLINPGVADYSCDFCRAGEHNLCVNYGILGEHLPGTLAEFITIPGANVAPIPPLDPPLTWAEAAAFSLVTLTAWRMLVTRARVRSGETVLIWGIGGGVSLAALQVAKLHGARVIATSSSDAKLARARALGADVTLNHTTQSVAKEVRTLTAKRGVDVVVENVGEATWEDSLKSLGKGGRLVTCGATTGPLVVSDVRRLFWNNLTIMGSTMGNAAEYQEIVRVLGTGALRPIVDHVYPLSQVRAAFERLQRGEQLGKITVEI
ncbi:MAG TPA: zinc-binding dehydrogenase [Gemmatimonadales bacterium]|nr:zinc-binding dehydrogenase [Gemmatimonadales bacterium]